MTDDEILSVARKRLDQGLCHSRTTRITRATDAEILQFAYDLRMAWRDELESRMLEWRGIDVEAGECACTGCGGSGWKTYGSTATYHGGAGGQSLTNDVCDRCWGSGKEGKPWPSHNRPNVKVRGAQLYPADPTACVWKRDEDGNWHTGCGGMFVLDEGTPGDNSMAFCCYCGKPLAGPNA